MCYLCKKMASHTLETDGCTFPKSSSTMNLVKVYRPMVPMFIQLSQIYEPQKFTLISSHSLSSTNILLQFTYVYKYNGYLFAYKILLISQ